MCQFIWQIGAVNFDSSPLPSIRVVPVLPASVVECLRATFSHSFFLIPSFSFRSANIWRIRYFVLALFALSFNCSIEHFPSLSSPFSDHKLLKWPLRLLFPFFPHFLSMPNSLSLNSVNSVLFCSIDLKKMFIHTMLISETEEMSLTTIVIFTTTGPSAHRGNYLQLTILSLLMRLLASKVRSDVLCKRPKNNKGKSLSQV